MTARLSKKLRQLDAFLVSDAVGDDAMLLSELDGFLAGIIISPALVMPGEWLPLVWGEGGPVFGDEAEAQAVIDLIMGHYNDVVRQLDRGRHSPIYDIDRDDSVLWELWIQGFWRALLLRPDAWLEFCADDDEDLQTATFTLTRLQEIATVPTADLEPMDVDDELRDLAPGLIPHAVAILHRARLGRDTKATPKAMPRVGRNDPCPCGSGRKFKACCLH